MEFSDRPPYTGFFSSNRSTDVVLKIVFNVISFISIVFIISWLDSIRLRTRYKRKVVSIGCSHFSSLFQPGAISELCLLADDAFNGSTLSSKMNGRTVVIISNWSQIEQYRDEIMLKKYDSKCPFSFSSKWKGLVLSDPFTVEFSKLADLFELVSQTLPVSILIGSASRSVDIFIRPLSNEAVLDSELVERLAFIVTIETVFGSTPLKKVSANVLYDNLTNLSRAFLQLHVSGRQNFAKPDDIIKAVDRVVGPFILFELDQGHIQSAESLNILSHLLSTRSCLTSARPALAEDLETFLTSHHLNHTLFECFVILHHCLTRCLRSIFAAFVLRPLWEQRVRSEIKSHSTSCPFSHCSEYTSEDCLEVDSECLPYCKALCLESIRFTVAGWPLGCVRESFRDSEVCLANDLVLFNEPAVFHDHTLWFKTQQAPASAVPQNHALFSPEERLGSPNSDYLVSRVLLNSKVCFIPRVILYRLLLAAVVRLLMRCKLRGEQSEGDERDEEFANFPLYLPLDSAKMCNVVLIK